MLVDGERPRRRSALPALGLILGLVVGGVLLAGVADGSRAAASLRAGECLFAPEEAQITQVDPVDCGEPHELEVIGTVDLAGGPYPGDSPTFAMGLDACESIFPDYVGEPYDGSEWFLNVFTPSAEGWDAGDRTATCLVFQFDENLDYVVLTGSARG